MHYLTLSDINLHHKRVLIREDFNVPMQNGKIMDDTRLRVAIPTIEYALKHGAAVILLSHLGRPAETILHTSTPTPTPTPTDLSLAPVAKKLSELLSRTHTHTPVRFISNWIYGFNIQPGEIVLCENTRFMIGEKKCDDALSKKIAALGDVFVMDAFAIAHRAEASTVGVANYIKAKCAGLLLDAELTALTKAFKNPEKPVVSIVGGSKVSTKMALLETLLDKVNILIVGGGIANTLLSAQNKFVGKSLIEKDWIEPAKKLLQKAAEKKVFIPLPIDVAVAKNFSATENAVMKLVDDISADDMILDVGPKTAATYSEIMQSAKTIVWNGPVGVFEFPAFSHGTKALADAIAHSSAFSIAGGGDTLSAIAQCHVADKINYLSTGGGAFLELMEGKTLPGVKALCFKTITTNVAQKF